MQIWNVIKLNGDPVSECFSVFLSLMESEFCLCVFFQFCYSEIDCSCRDRNQNSLCSPKISLICSGVHLHKSHVILMSSSDLMRPKLTVVMLTHTIFLRVCTCFARSRSVRYKRAREIYHNSTTLAWSDKKEHIQENEACRVWLYQFRSFHIKNPTRPIQMVGKGTQRNLLSVHHLTMSSGIKTLFTECQDTSVSVLFPKVQEHLPKLTLDFTCERSK